MNAGHMNADSVPLADALDCAASAWLKLRAGRALEVALDDALAQAQRDTTHPPHPRLRAATQDLTTTAVRRLALIEAAIDHLAQRKPDAEVDALLCVALGQLFAARYPAHTLVDQTVRAAKSRASTQAAAGFINALLRNAQRGGTALIDELRRHETVRWNAPAWWITRLRKSWPNDWRHILEAAQTPAPLVLRVNTRRSSCERMLQKLRAAGIEATRIGAVALRLERALPVDQIPGFAEGEVSVQDAGAQLAARWLNPAPGARVLDACAAPGGKTAHLAEQADVTVDAVEIDPRRAARIQDNLNRLGLSERVRVIVGDASTPEVWAGDSSGDSGGDSNGDIKTDRRYDAIVLDAPCTASGIVRRHPDIPWLRRPTDVALLARTQTRLLDALWPRLNPAGRLLYVVCSVFPEEGMQQIEAFLRRHTDAVLRPLPHQEPGAAALQLLPTAAHTGLTPTDDDRPSEHDGFCYALIEKRR